MNTNVRFFVDNVKNIIPLDHNFSFDKYKNNLFIISDDKPIVIANNTTLTKTDICKKISKIKHIIKDEFLVNIDVILSIYNDEINHYILYPNEVKYVA